MSYAWTCVQSPLSFSYEHDGDEREPRLRNNPGPRQKNNEATSLVCGVAATRCPRLYIKARVSKNRKPHHIVYSLTFEKGVVSKTNGVFLSASKIIERLPVKVRSNELLRRYV